MNINPVLSAILDHAAEQSGVRPMIISIPPMG
jgi:hypothetical protein